MVALDNNVTTAAGRMAQHCFLAQNSQQRRLAFTVVWFAHFAAAQLICSAEMSVVQVNDANWCCWQATGTFVCVFAGMFVALLHVVAATKVWLPNQLRRVA